MHFKGFFNKGVLGKTVSETAGVYNTPYAGQRYVTNSDKSSLTETSHVWSSLRMRGSGANNTASFVGDIFPNKRALSQCRYDSALGRSMIEMLGVLAIIGVLSIAAVAGYRFALLKFRANEVTNELNMRAINVSAQMLNTGTVYEKNELIEDGFGDTLTVGFPVETAISDRNTDYFEILVSDIPADLCRQILRDYENPIMIFVNNVRYNADTTICDDETQNALNDMGFIYKNDLGTHEACSEKGYFDEEDFQCHCSGNTYLDIYTNDCLCPAGHIWSAGEGTCIESICPEGEFETSKNGCVPCSDETNYTIATDQQKAICLACGNREAYTFNTQTYCYNLKPACVSGTTFRQLGGTCISCTATAHRVYVPNTTDAINSCNACPNRMYDSSQCIIKTCLPGYFLASDKCYDCNTPDTVSMSNATYQNSCLACGNRSIINNTCVKTTCSTGEFMGADGKCYACDQPKKIAVNAGSGCTDTACERVEVTSDGKTYCQIADCPTDGTYVNVDGSCYPCAGSTPFQSTKEQCDQCLSPQRLWLGTENADGTAIGKCMTKCKMGVSYPHASATLCYGCAGSYDGSGYLGTSATAREYCEACGNYLDGEWCVRPNSCVRGSEFRRKVSGYSFCATCDLVEKINIGTTAVHRDMCSACTTKPRFWIGEYCYRCDSPETPDVTSTDEEKSCRTCDEREVKDGKCILIQ